MVVAPAFTSATPVVTVSHVHVHALRAAPCSRRGIRVAKRQRVRLCTPTVATLVAPSDAPSSECLSRFAEAVRGEWRGYEGMFDRNSGKVLPIPDYYVPEQFSEWGVTPLGFETTHSTIVRDTRLFRKLFRILPTVSLFADHVDTEEDLHILPLHPPDLPTDPSVALFDDGSFIAGPAQVQPKRESRLDKHPTLEFCLRDPTTANPTDKQRAANFWVSFDFEKRTFVKDVRVLIEAWECTYCDGADLEGSSGFVDGWTSGAAVDAHLLDGVWHDSLGKPIAQQAPPSEEGQGSRLLLPDGLHLSILPDGGGGGVVVQVGWLVDADTRVVLSRSFGPDGSISGSERSVYRRVE